MDCLVVYTVDEWTRILEETLSKLNLHDPMHRRFWGQFNRDVDEICPDEKMGRISISKKLLDMAKIEKDVIFVGMGRTIHIWDKAEYEAQTIPDDEFAQLAQTLLG